MRKIVLTGLALGACATTTYTPFSGTQIDHGAGGILVAEANGIAVYDVGLPNGRVCRVKGHVNDDRGEGIFQQSGKWNKITTLASKGGGNTVLRNYRVDNPTGYMGTRNMDGAASDDITLKYTEIAGYTVYDCD